MTPDQSHNPSLRGTVDGIVQEVARAITDAKLAQLDAIAERMVAARDEVRDFLKTIHSRPDAVFHIRVSTIRAKNPHITLSVRIHGVEAGQGRGSRDAFILPEGKMQDTFRVCKAIQRGGWVPGFDFSVSGPVGPRIRWLKPSA